jgi:hypothetical protein
VAVAIDPGLAQTLTDARLQLHHAAQLATATGISYLPAEPDDSHTNLEWVESLRALAGHVVPAPQPFRAVIQPADLSLSIAGEDNQIVASTLLHGLTMDDAANWLRARIPSGADGDRLTLSATTRSRITTSTRRDLRHEERRRVRQLDAFARGESRGTRSSTTEANAVRCCATSTCDAVGLGAGERSASGWNGDQYCRSLTNERHRRQARGGASLGGGGTWHTEEWVGAVLPGSRLGEEPKEQVHAFLDSAIIAARAIQRKS